jgi:hypothetical protein
MGECTVLLCTRTSQIAGVLQEVRRALYSESGTRISVVNSGKFPTSVLKSQFNSEAK